MVLDPTTADGPHAAIAPPPRNVALSVEAGCTSTGGDTDGCWQPKPKTTGVPAESPAVAAPAAARPARPAFFSMGCGKSLGTAVLLYCAALALAALLAHGERHIVSGKESSPSLA